MAEQKLIDVIELLRQSQEETKAEIITSRHSIQVMNTEIVESLRILANNVETNEDREERMRREAAAAGGQVDKETKVEPEGGFLGFLSPDLFLFFATKSPFGLWLVSEEIYISNSAEHMRDHLH